MTTDNKRDPANVPQEVKLYMFRKLFGDKEKSDGHAAIVGLDQANHLAGDHPASGAGNRDRNGVDAGLLEAVKLAYRKHHLEDTAIGWDELSEALQDALCEAMGDAEFQAWLKEVKP